MNKIPHWHEAFQVIGKHLFVAYAVYMENPQRIIIIADTLDQAENAAERHWPDRKLCVRQARQLENVQIYD